MWGSVGAVDSKGGAASENHSRGGEGDCGEEEGDSNSNLGGGES